MSRNSLKFQGLEELRAALRNLPAELTAEATRIVEGAANGAAADIKRNYPVRTGHLRDHLTVTHYDQGKFSTGAIVKNTSPHAWMFENGTQARHTAIGANRGAMPPGHVFIPRITRARRLMWTQLKELLTRKGLLVTSHE
jgi:hypothetical protein